ncbi:MAG: amino acid permease [Dysgonamonadaceae bacterium]|nr:amino acid permease [Dysgonamonadaceae bacterium]
MKSKLFRTKVFSDLINDSEDTERGLKRSLSATNLITLGIGCIIGTGIFVLTGTAAANHAGPALTISFIISAIGCIMAGLCYAEFAAMIPVAGSAYSYSYATIGEFIAWFIGWDLILEYLFASSTVAVGWSGYAVSFLNDWGIHIPDYLCRAPFDHIAGEGWIMTGSLINFPALFIVAITAALLILGIKESASFNNIIVIVKLAVILLFIGFGLSYINPENWTPYIPENTGTFGQFGWSGILTGAGVIFFAYIGFDAVSTVAQEAKHPQRDMPKGILISLLICTVLYVLVTAILTGMVPYTELNVPAPIALAIDRTGNTLYWLRPLIKIGAVAGLSSVILVMLIAQTRVFYSMSKDGLLPPVFSRVHRRYRTPHLTTIIVGSVSAVIAGLFPINILGELVSIGTLMAFTIVCISILVLRKVHPDVKRPFKTPWVPFVPVLGAVICIAQMIALPVDTWIRLLVWLIIGLCIYFSYGIRHSKMNNEQ